ncbi:hypothetical protein [Actinomadura parmotrematis]|uniref:Uncharacterized protein n=1 Tax=Actinomadura parmotrematis TaxID=2864039 RepID=A0ABS7FUA2_9ACTN|nr:hypothetical protein [Actinomadura parmotrematis]MBW8483989.1 hypothetical protein [Actinomadura parmotrematis]
MNDAFGTVDKYVKLFGAIGAVVLATVAAMALTGHEATAFMWIRGMILFAASFLLHRYTVRAARGSDRALDRLRTLATILPIAIVGVDLVPGLCPPWYAVLQGLSALALVGVAVLTRRPALRSTRD